MDEAEWRDLRRILLQQDPKVKMTAKRYLLNRDIRRNALPFR
ncbi:hypothetical protein ACLK1X_16215 [Escherichia coli]